MDCSKGSFPDNRHRALTHNAWFIVEVLPRVCFANSGPKTPDHKFPTIVNSDGKHVSTREIGEQHVLEDFRMKFIPTVADYLSGMQMELWMNNGMQGSVPPSHAAISTGDAMKEMVKRKLAAAEVD